MKRVEPILYTALFGLASVVFAVALKSTSLNVNSSVLAYPGPDPEVFLPLVSKPRFPLFVGLQSRWDGNGYVRGTINENIGTHWQMTCDGMTDSDTLRCQGAHWYDPNPFGWDSSQWDEYYSVSTGALRSSSTPPNPDWKWGYPWILPYAVLFGDNQTWYLGGQAFLVTGPHSGYTAFGQAVQFWQLVNTEQFLYYDSGGEWTQYVHPGDIVLKYDGGVSRLLLYSNIRRTYYFQGARTNNTVQYIFNLTYTNAFPSPAGMTTSTVLVPPARNETTTGEGEMQLEMNLRGSQQGPLNVGGVEFENAQ